MKIIILLLILSSCTHKTIKRTYQSDVRATDYILCVEDPILFSIPTKK
ncbi:MAG: hypothetical protein ACO20H_01215 [Bacteriovoracaceae bacterium]